MGVEYAWSVLKVPIDDGTSEAVGKLLNDGNLMVAAMATYVDGMSTAEVPYLVLLVKQEVT